MGTQLLAVLSPLALLLVFRYFITPLRSASRRLPPGPKPLPLIGNLLDVPLKEGWLKFAEWRKQYGDVIFLDIPGTPFLILNSQKSCSDLLERRSSIYSGRLRAPMVSEVVGWNWIFPLMGYTARWRRHRRIFHQYFNEHATLDHRPSQERSAYKLLDRLLHTPDDFLSHVRFGFAEIMAKVSYSANLKGPEDPYVLNAEIALGAIATAGLPGKFWVNLIPFLKYIPSWMPGAEFKRTARKWNKIVTDMTDVPYFEFQEKVANGTAKPCVLSSVLSRYRDGLSQDEAGPTSEQESIEDIAKSVVHTAYVAGADTSVASIQTLFLVMANHPDVQRRAQEELDAVVGQNRLPTFEDIDNLPYVNALIKELFRWHTVAPLGVLHMTTDDDEYEGYFIPKGTTVIPNIWLILHDPEVYHNPHKFDPLRWLINQEGVLKPNSAIPEPTSAFGFGRRVCPGRHFAENSIFITASTILACFDISPLDSAGRPAKQVEANFDEGLVIHPAPFKVAIKPRSDQAVSLISETIAATSEM